MTKDPEKDYFKEWLSDQTKVRRLLLIDDSMEDCMLIQRHTYRYHCEWAMANSLSNAEYCLNNMAILGGFSLIFLDLNLGAGPNSGVEAFQSLKKKFPSIPVVVLSGNLTTDAVTRITKIGFAMFAQKPNSFTNEYFAELFRIMSIPKRPGFHDVRDDVTESP